MYFVQININGYRSHCFDLNDSFFVCTLRSLSFNRWFRFLLVAFLSHCLSFLVYVHCSLFIWINCNMGRIHNSQIFRWFQFQTFLFFFSANCYCFNLILIVNRFAFRKAFSLIRFNEFRMRNALLCSTK